MNKTGTEDFIVNFNSQIKENLTTQCKKTDRTTNNSIKHYIEINKMSNTRCLPDFKGSLRCSTRIGKCGSTNDNGHFAHIKYLFDDVAMQENRKKWLLCHFVVK